MEKERKREGRGVKRAKKEGRREEGRRKEGGSTNVDVAEDGLDIGVGRLDGGAVLSAHTITSQLT